MHELTQETFRARGFLSPEPIIDARAPFDRISILAGQLPELIASGASTLRKEIESLPMLDTSEVTDPLILRALMRDYHFLQSAYVKSRPETQVIPACLAVPSYALAQLLERKPMLSYASMVLDNWDHACDTPFVFENVRPIRTFTGTKHEKAFLVPHALIEYEARVAVDQVAQIIEDVLNGRIDALIPRLHSIADAFARMQTLFAYIKKYCKPKMYAEQIRPWIDRFTNVTFEGVAEITGVPQSLIGPSGAQSSLLPLIDAILCIRHDRDRLSEYLGALRKYMPPEHVSLIEQAEAAQSLREFVRQSGDADLRNAYCVSIRSVHSFRVIHGAFTELYIGAQKTYSHGSGGSDYSAFVARYINDTEAALL